MSNKKENSVFLDKAVKALKGALAKRPDATTRKIALPVNGLHEPSAHIRRAAAEIRARYGSEPEQKETKMSKKTLVTQVREHTAKALEEFKAAVTILEDLSKKYATLAADLAKAEQANQHPKQETPAKKRRTAEAKQHDAPAEQAPQAPSIPRHRQSASVHHTAHELTLNIGSFPVQQLAEDDAKDFLNNQMVFWYRPMQFPDPRRYKVQPHIESARVVKRADKKFTRAPWTVSVTISIVGDDKRCDAWGTGVLSKNKGDQE